ncbi:glycosyltransferase family 2 protein [Nocardia cyriacigeorgica]|uniref:Glycosyltransferase family 2 protein n=1 Tax=Nocardia cyriacigeorgica TaxID=135487 RepID=A0A6P1CPQ6_9NOCA|nr:glycosyltransferase family 2 protein [Nocardia cyriacigeorgica]NEW34488.1 glycosyltransferase family 2 protein [Nocardia cyriacigeorgica]
MSTTPPAGPARTAIADFYRSVDSAPAGYSVDRPASASNGFLIMFAGLSVVVMCIQLALRQTHLVQHNDLVILAGDRGNVAMPTRIFIVVFFLTYAYYAYSNRWRRLFLGVSLLGKFLLSCVFFDVLAWFLDDIGLLRISVFGQQVASALVALAIFPHTVLRQARLPEPVRMAINPRTPAGAYVKLFIPFTLALALAALFEQVFLRLVLDLREWALLGGMGPGVFLAQQIFAALTALLGWQAITRSRRGEFSPPVAVLVPAHDEAHDIAATILAVDRAARTYTGRIHLYVVDNASTDDTSAVAEQAISECTAITGEVLECPRPGKAIALNMGVERITEEFIVRIDADTVIGDGCLQTAMRHFTNPRVGSVGGLPLPMPVPQQTWIDKVRLVEVYLRHGFFQVSLDGYQGVLGIPGMFAIYRRSVLLQVGGMVEGMNGEDTDICLRMDAAGYHTIADPKAIYFSETPRTYAHLREQRVRWFRSIYHITGHNRATLLDRRSMTGSFVLPFQLVNAARRAMLAPLLIFAVVVEVAFRASYGELRWQPIVATALGMQMIMAAIVCLCWRSSSVKYIPAYLCFRVLRSYFTLGAALSLVYPPLEPCLPLRRRRRPPARTRGYSSRPGGPAMRSAPRGAAASCNSTRTGG